MFSGYHSVSTTTASKQQIWKLWADVPQWKQWSKDLIWSTIDGDFKLGATIKLKPVGGPVNTLVVTECTNLTSFTTTTRLPLATMCFIHELKETVTGLQVITTITITGPLSFVFGKLLGKKLVAHLPQTNTDLIKLASAQ